ncbi:hypothetical protein GCM10027318_01170 [Massilia agilis]
MARADGFPHEVRTLANSISTKTQSIEASVDVLIEKYPGLDRTEANDLLKITANSMKSIDLAELEKANRVLRAATLRLGGGT